MGVRLDRFCEALRGLAVTCKRLRNGHAFSERMNVIRNEIMLVPSHLLALKSRMANGFV